VTGLTCFFFSLQWWLASQLHSRTLRFRADVADQSRTICDRYESAAPSTLFALKSVVIAILSINLAASSAFLHEWNEAVTAFSSVVNTDPGSGKIEIVSEDQLRTLLGPARINLTNAWGSAGRGRIARLLLRRISDQVIWSRTPKRLSLSANPSRSR
jgi:hypothetical protein